MLYLYVLLCMCIIYVLYVNLMFIMWNIINVKQM